MISKHVQFLSKAHPTEDNISIKHKTAVVLAYKPVSLLMAKKLLRPP